MSEDPTAVGTVIDPWHTSFYDALRDRDAETVESLVTGDVVFMPVNNPTVRGANEVRKWFDDYFRRVRIQELLETQRSVNIVDKWAFEWGSHSITIAPLIGGGESMTDDVRFLHVWQLQPDRRWRLARMMWNISRPAK